jgi:hypothetical protein
MNIAPAAISPPTTAISIPITLAVDVPDDSVIDCCKNSPQCLHLAAAAKMGSAQNGHGCVVEAGASEATTGSATDW